LIEAAREVMWFEWCVGGRWLRKTRGREGGMEKMEQKWSWGLLRESRF